MRIWAHSAGRLDAGGLGEDDEKHSDFACILKVELTGLFARARERTQSSRRKPG